MLPPDFFDDPAGQKAAVSDLQADISGQPRAATTTPVAPAAPAKTVLPSDFFDNPEAAPVGLIAPDQLATEAEAKLEAEWTAFQRSITQATHKNELMAREEVEATARERAEDEQLEEEVYKERLAGLRRLRNLVFEARGNPGAARESDCGASAAEKEATQLPDDHLSSESDSDEDIEALMDWRTKAII